jgi:hypothetical protein
MVRTGIAFSRHGQERLQRSLSKRQVVYGKTCESDRRPIRKHSIDIDVQVL